jgi:hypothetical protein
VTGKKLAEEAEALKFPGKIIAIATDITKRDSFDGMVAIGTTKVPTTVFALSDCLPNNGPSRQTLPK